MHLCLFVSSGMTNPQLTTAHTHNYRSRFETPIKIHGHHLWTIVEYMSHYTLVPTSEPTLHGWG